MRCMIGVVEEYRRSFKRMTIVRDPADILLGMLRGFSRDNNQLIELWYNTNFRGKGLSVLTIIERFVEFRATLNGKREGNTSPSLAQRRIASKS